MYDQNALQEWMKGSSPGEEFVVSRGDIESMSSADVSQFNSLLNNILEDRGTEHMKFDYKLTNDARGYVFSRVK